MKNLTLYLSIIIICNFQHLNAENIPIEKYSIDTFGCVQLQINTSSKYYYILHFKPELDREFELPISIVMGQDGTTTFRNGLKAFPQEHYRISKHPKNSPNDTDSDGLDDMKELANLGHLGPFNPAPAISHEDGVVCIPDKATFEKLSYKGDRVSNDLHLKDLEYVKFYILKTDTNNPQVYFMNTNKHRYHSKFAKTIGFHTLGRTTMRGEIIYHPNILSPNGRLGVYRFEFEPLDKYSFDKIQISNEILAANLPFLNNNWTYYPMPKAAHPKYKKEKELYDKSRVAIISNDDIYNHSDYLPLNRAEGYGLLKKMDLDERPNLRDIVLYEALPNEMSRVGGIITSVPQTPLSHVNLRAIQDNVPNAYIAGALITENITKLIGKYVYYKVEKNTYKIRLASLAEVEKHYDKLRPNKITQLKRNLSVEQIQPLSKIDFDSSTSFGAKASNIATMLKFGFPEGTIPNGFAVPFYFYDEFMKFNNFYNDVEAMLSYPEFIDNYDVQAKMLKEFQDKIKTAKMPKWMMKKLNKMHKTFPKGTSIRCRSSTNNEDLLGFSGAGLYDSKTQKPDEGHISKSIKQVYASLWSFRAFDERQFYKIDHFSVAMGVLCHPNYPEEKANGVGVSTDPIHGTKYTYYLNTQLGENLVTNPESLSIPEEILIHLNQVNIKNYSVIRTSNLVAENEKIMSDDQLKSIQNCLAIIQSKFRELYKTSNQRNFAMEIEYKITKENKLIIKQARPWITGSIKKMQNIEN